jgi:hypothetical protein
MRKVLSRIARCRNWRQRPRRLDQRFIASVAVSLYSALQHDIFERETRAAGAISAAFPETQRSAR